MFNKANDLLKKYSLLYVLYGEMGLNELSIADKRIFIIAYNKYIK